MALAAGLLAGLTVDSAPSGAATAHMSVATATVHAAAMAIVEKRVLSYPYDQVWPTAIRYLRVDRGYDIQDKDADAGYLLFAFELPGADPDVPRVGQGSMELVRTRDAADRPAVQIQVATHAGPVHLPYTIVDGLAAKVRDERGQPAQPPSSPPSPSPPPKPPQNDPGQPGPSVPRPGGAPKTAPP